MPEAVAPAAAPAAPANGAAKGTPQAPVAPKTNVKPGAPMQAAPEADADPVVWEGKVDGRPTQVRKSQAEKYFSKGAFADQTIQQARELAKAAQKAQQEFAQKDAEAKRRAKEDTEAWLRENGIDPDEFSRARLQKRVDEGKMSPEERRAADAEARAKALEAKLAEQTKRDEEQQRTQLTTHLERNIQSQLMAAVKRANLTTGPDTLYALHEAMNEMMSLNLLPMDGTGLPAHVADRIVEDAQARISGAQSSLEKAVLGGLKGAALKARLGDVVYKEVLAHALEEVRSRRPGYKPPAPGTTPAPAPAPAAPTTGYKRVSEYDARVRELAGKHTS